LDWGEALKIGKEPPCCHHYWKLRAVDDIIEAPWKFGGVLVLGAGATLRRKGGSDVNTTLGSWGWSCFHHPWKLGMVKYGVCVHSGAINDVDMMMMMLTMK